MIYRAVVEGGSSLSNMDSFHLFFQSTSDLEAKASLKELAKCLFGASAPEYEIYNVFSEYELFDQSLEINAFVDCHLVESGSSEGKQKYARDAIVFLVGRDRARVVKALKEGEARS